MNQLLEKRTTQLIRECNPACSFPTRDQIRPGSAALSETTREPRLIYQGQFCRPAHLPARRQLLQDRPDGQLPASAAGHRSQGISGNRQDDHCLRPPRSPRLRPDLDIRLHTGKIERHPLLIQV